MGGRAWGGKGWNFDVQIALSHATVTLCTTDLLLKPAQPLTIKRLLRCSEHFLYSTAAARVGDDDLLYRARLLGAGWQDLA